MDIPDTRSCCEVKLVAVAIPRVLTPATCICANVAEVDTRVGIVPTPLKLKFVPKIGAV